MTDNVDKDDIAAIVSRMDAQIVVMIELLAELHGKDVKDFKNRYTGKYDRYAERFRRGALK